MGFEMTTFTKEQAEGLWDVYNADNNDTLTVDEVKNVIKEELLKSKCEQTEEDEVDVDTLVKEKYAFFKQKEAKPLTKKEFVDGMVMANKCVDLKNIFTDLDKDKSGQLTKDELESGLSKFDNFSKEQVEILMDELAEDKDKQYDIKEFVD